MGGHCCRCCSLQEPNDEDIFDFIRSLSHLSSIHNVGTVTSRSVRSQASNSLDSTTTPSWLSFEETDDVNENVFIGEETICFVCLENYNDGKNQPRIMPCGHIVCNQCLIGLAKTFLYTEIKCPQDRQVYRVKRRCRRGEENRLPPSSDNESVVQEDIQTVPNIPSMPTYLTSSSSDDENESINVSDNVSREQFSIFANHQRSIPSSVYSSSISRSFANAECGSEKSENGVPSFVESIWGTKRYQDIQDEHFNTNFYEEPLPDYPINSSEDEDT